jgi:two-component system CheB/CheR fusion protein
LTLVRSLTELHGGTATAASEGPGRGTEFTIRLPAAERPGSQGGAAGPAGLAGGQARVLVVDDNVDLARGLARLLKLLGHEVQMVHDGPSALEAARAFRPVVVLLDIGLPGLDGYEVARRLRREDWGRDAQIIAITGYGQEDDRRRSTEAGCDHHLVKPIDFKALVSVLAETAA